MAIKSPPGLIPLSHLSGEELLAHLRFNRVTDEKGRYLPFDELQYRIKKGENVDVAWTLTRLARNAAIQRINYCNEAGEQAGFNITPVIAEACELVDKRATALALKDQTERLRGAGAELSQLRLEEPITSSQLEGANTTTLVARKMLETGRSPRTEDEHMIAGNARLMAEIPHLLAEPLTPALIRQLHAIGMGGINDAKYRPGEFRETDDVVIADYDGTVLIVSHDRDFLDRTVTITLGLDGSGRVDIVAGGYADWEKQRQARAAQSKKAPLPPGGGVGGGPVSSATNEIGPPLTPPASGRGKKLTYKDQRDYDLLPARIEEIAAQIARDEAALHDPALYTRDPAKFAALTKAIEIARAEKDAAEGRWLELAELVEG